jgi:hypothetical protein
MFLCACAITHVPYRRFPSKYRLQVEYQFLSRQIECTYTIIDKVWRVISPVEMIHARKYDEGMTSYLLSVEYSTMSLVALN